MISFNEFKNNSGVGAFFGKLMAARQYAHILHLASKSFSEHKALGNFYDEINNLTDDLVETYQGQYGLVIIESTSFKNKGALEFLSDFAQEAKEARGIFDKSDTHLHNIIDEIIALIYKTHYMVKYLK